MILTGDFHTHTVYSHGKGTIFENAEQAKNKGLKYLAITDHGFSHPAFGMKRKELLKMKTECYEAQKLTGVNVLLGMEGNILNDKGKIDFKKEDYEKFDIMLAGFHKFVKASPSAYFKLLIPNYFTYKFGKKPSSRLIKETTKAYINVIKNNPVDIITHINFCVFADVCEVAKVCADYGTYLELNSKKTHLTDEEIEKILKTDVRFVVDSDAHSVDRIGDTERVVGQLSHLDFPMDRIDNIDGRTPKFRFAEYKKVNL